MQLCVTFMVFVGCIFTKEKIFIFFMCQTKQRHKICVDIFSTGCFVDAVYVKKFSLMKAEFVKLT